MRAKICGITQLADAQAAVQNGAWALGFNFYSKSPRYLAPHVAKEMIQQLPAHIVKVGILIENIPFNLSEFISDIGLDLIQVYDVLNTPDDLKNRTILSLQATKPEHLPPPEVLKQFGYLLLDSPQLSDGLKGGTGRLSNWEMAALLAKHYRLILAGGLTPQNIRAAMKTVRPYAVDVASGVQKTPGKLDQGLLTDFLRQVNDEQ